MCSRSRSWLTVQDKAANGSLYAARPELSKFIIFKRRKARLHLLRSSFILLTGARKPYLRRAYHVCFMYAQ